MLPGAALLGLTNLELPYKPDELYRVPTDDGAAISLGRYQPRGPRRFVEPVLLTHGLGANRFAVDFDERYSLARFLARRGYETWVMELRGRGLAGACGEYCFDDQAEHDLRVALRTITSTGAPAVTFVGHSKGGLALYAHLAMNPEAPLKAAVAIGSPFTFTVQPGLRRFIERVEPVLRLKAIPTSSVRGLAALGPPPGPISRYLALGTNMDPEVTKRAMYNMAADISRGVGQQFARWIKNSSFDSNDGKTNYRDRLGQVRTPFLLVAGSRDLLAPPMAVARAQRYLGGPTKMVVAGKAHGFAEDYGHGDLLLGRKAPDEIFPVVESFLAAHSTAA